MKQLEFGIDAVRRGIRESEVASTAEDAATMKISLGLWAVILFLAAMILYALVR